MACSGLNRGGTTQCESTACATKMGSRVDGSLSYLPCECNEGALEMYPQRRVIWVSQAGLGTGVSAFLVSGKVKDRRLLPCYQGRSAPLLDGPEYAFRGECDI